MHTTGNIDELTQEIVEWADQVFPDRTNSSALLKLFEEVGELVKDPHSPGEYADICIMVFDLAHMHGVDLASAIKEKMQINKARTWRVTATGTLQHEP
jgi:NTP pyrophosphatase (non-canonical NTP hydrolase)